MQSAGPRAPECPADRREPARTSCRTPRRGGGRELGALGLGAGGWALGIGKSETTSLPLSPLAPVILRVLRVLRVLRAPGCPAQLAGTERCSITIRHSPQTRRNTAVQAP